MVATDLRQWPVGGLGSCGLGKVSSTANPQATAQLGKILQQLVAAQQCEAQWSP